MIVQPSNMHDLYAKAAAWNLTIDETRETATSLLGYGVRAGQPVVLKISKHDGDEANSGAVLDAFDGNGAVRVYKYEPGAVLLERLEPGEQLANVVKRGDDDEATRVIAGVISKLAHRVAPRECPTVTDWGRGFDRYLNSEDRRLPVELIHEARRLYHDLESTQSTTMLLHGDLQHYNILYDKRHGWVAIDPKGVAGELEYEVGPLLRNPVELPELFANTATIRGRLEILTTTLPLNYSRVVSWSYAQAVLSAIWDIEDGYPLQPNNPSLLLAHVLRPML